MNNELNELMTNKKRDAFMVDLLFAFLVRRRFQKKSS